MDSEIKNKMHQGYDNRMSKVIMALCPILPKGLKGAYICIYVYVYIYICIYMYIYLYRNYKNCIIN